MAHHALFKRSIVAVSVQTTHKRNYLPAKLTRLIFICGVTWMSTASGDGAHSSDVCTVSRLSVSPLFTV